MHFADLPLPLQRIDRCHQTSVSPPGTYVGHTQLIRLVLITYLVKRLE